MEKVKKFPLAEFLGFMIFAKKCTILNMSKAMEKCKNRNISSKLNIRNLLYWSLNILFSTGHREPFENVCAKALKNFCLRC